MIKQVFLDMDGVLADFDSHFNKMYPEYKTGTEYENEHGWHKFWLAVWHDPNFFANIEPYPYLNDLLMFAYRAAQKKTCILSCPSRVNKELCILQKRQWLDEHVSSMSTALFYSSKHHFADEHSLLIDDRLSNCEKFRQAGGHAIHFCNYESCVEELEQLIC